VQRIIDSREYAALYPNTRLNTVNIRTVVGTWLRNADEFEIVERMGGLVTAGIGGGSITGRAVDVFIIDDPYKDPKDAWSPAVRQSIQDWYDTVASARLHNDSKQLITLTRWHQDDLAGVLLKREPEEWETIVFTALKEGMPNDIDPREEGTALWPEKHSLERLLKAKANNPQVFQSLYQQNPKPAEGLLFPAETLQYFEMADIRNRIPDGIIAAADVADTGSDYYCMLVAYLFEYDIYVVDCIYTQAQAEITEPLTLGALDNWRVQRFRIESNAGGRLYAKSIKEKAKGFTTIEAVPSSSNKETRILTASGQIKQHFYFRQDYVHGSDYGKFYDHLTNYTIIGPNEHDDAPDTVTMLLSTAEANLRNWALDTD
jgi:predicted phage terminase large subunit-like protein